jgi:hypothetical protein
VSIVAVLIGLVSLAMSVIAVTLAVVLDSKALANLAVALVLLGAQAIVFGIAYAGILLQRRRPDLGRSRDFARPCLASATIAPCELTKSRCHSG